MRQRVGGAGVAPVVWRDGASSNQLSPNNIGDTGRMLMASSERNAAYLMCACLRASGIHRLPYSITALKCYATERSPVTDMIANPSAGSARFPGPFYWVGSGMAWCGDGFALILQNGRDVIFISDSDNIALSEGPADDNNLNDNAMIRRGAPAGLTNRAGYLAWSLRQLSPSLLSQVEDQWPKGVTASTQHGTQPRHIVVTCVASSPPSASPSIVSIGANNGFVFSTMILPSNQPEPARARVALATINIDNKSGIVHPITALTMICLDPPADDALMALCGLTYLPLLVIGNAAGRIHIYSLLEAAMAAKLHLTRDAGAGCEPSAVDPQPSHETTPPPPAELLYKLDLSSICQNNYSEEFDNQPYSILSIKAVCLTERRDHRERRLVLTIALDRSILVLTLSLILTCEHTVSRHQAPSASYYNEGPLTITLDDESDSIPCGTAKADSSPSSPTILTKNDHSRPLARNDCPSDRAPPERVPPIHNTKGKRDSNFSEPSLFPTRRQGSALDGVRFGRPPPLPAPSREGSAMESSQGYKTPPQRPLGNTRASPVKDSVKGPSLFSTSSSVTSSPYRGGYPSASSQCPDTSLRHVGYNSRITRVSVTSINSSFIARGGVNDIIAASKRSMLNVSSKALALLSIPRFVLHDVQPNSGSSSRVTSTGSLNDDEDGLLAVAYTVPSGIRGGATSDIIRAEVSTIIAMRLLERQCRGSFLGGPDEVILNHCTGLSVLDLATCPPRDSTLPTHLDRRDFLNRAIASNLVVSHGPALGSGENVTRHRHLEYSLVVYAVALDHHASNRHNEFQTLSAMGNRPPGSLVALAVLASPERLPTYHFAINPVSGLVATASSGRGSLRYVSDESKDSGDAGPYAIDSNDGGASALATGLDEDGRMPGYIRLWHAFEAWPSLIANHFGVKRENGLDNVGGSNAGTPATTRSGPSRKSSGLSPCDDIMDNQGDLR